MEQIIKRLYYGTLDDEVLKMRKLGYTIKQISSAGEYYVYTLFEKTEKVDNNVTV